MTWDLLIDEQVLADLLGTEYARFARPVKEGLLVFLSGLPGETQQEILAEQMALAPDASLSERLGLLARRSPVLHKLGQVLARDVRLAEELRAHFRPLESLPPTVDVETIRQVLVQELGLLEDRRIKLAAAPIAEASVAVEISFCAQGIRGPYEGVFKLLKPGIAARLDLELELISRVGTHLDDECEALGIPPLDAATQTARLRVATDMMLFRKTLHMLEGVIGELGTADIRIEDVLLAEFVRHFGQEWPDRWFALPTSRAFSTRLSNADLAATLLSWPLAAARFWQAEWLDCLRSRHRMGT